MGVRRLPLENVCIRRPKRLLFNKKNPIRNETGREEEDAVFEPFRVSNVKWLLSWFR